MPAGLDGNPDPVVSPQRTAVIEEVVSSIARSRIPGRPLLVGIDGIDGSGKSTFADELAIALAAVGTTATRASIDSFHRPREQRWARGRSSPAGFYLDSHDLDAVRQSLLDPYTSGQGHPYVTETFDEPSNQPIDAEARVVGADEVLLFDGIFVQRPELATYWDLTVFLDGSARVALDRLGYVVEELPADPALAAIHALDWAATLDRYASGMRWHLDLIQPADACSILIDNNDLARPTITANRT
ncbi:MAG: hypothetical protein WBP59_11165 [Ilumatobacteraceae bacterium]